MTLTRGAAPVSEADLIGWCRARLAPYKIPVIVRIVDALPANASMKIDRTALREMLLRRAALTAAS